MKYLCLVYIDGKKIGALSARELKRLDRDSLNYDDGLKKSGHLIAAEALQPVSAARTVVVRKGKVSITDGPFAETKEHLGGFILVNAPDQDEAIQLAAGVPIGEFGRIEVRPVYDVPDPREKKKSPRKASANRGSP